MPMLRVCAHSGCETLSLGTFCIRHEEPVEARVFPRGRPFPPHEQRHSVRSRSKADEFEPVRGFA